MTTRIASAPRPKVALRPLTLGGMLVVCGPPLGGKGPLAARLEEMLPNVVKLEAVDNLSVEGQSYLPRLVRSKAVSDVEPMILNDAQRIWQATDAIPPLILICARFETPTLRAAAADLARARGMRFLLVEANSRPIRSMRRISRLMLSANETSVRLARYEKTRRAYQATTAMERAQLPAIAFKTVLSNLEDTADRVMTVWCQGG